MVAKRNKGFPERRNATNENSLPRRLLDQDFMKSIKDAVKRNLPAAVQGTPPVHHLIVTTKSEQVDLESTKLGQNCRKGTKSHVQQWRYLLLHAH